MRDITRNIFYWFRGPAAGGDAGTHRQLENNLTKSLMTVLEHCDRQVVLKAFLGRLGLQLDHDVVFSLQRKPHAATTTRKRVLVGITGGDAELIEGQREADAGRPDAWICGRHWTVLIEGKIGAKLPEKELRGHARAAGWAPGTYRTEYLSWNDLCRLYKNAVRRIRMHDRVTRLLLEEWLSYMEHQNMTEFERLEAVDFDFSNLSSEERRALLPHLKTRIRGFARLLAKTPPARKIAGLYAEQHIDLWRFGEPR